MQTIVLVEHLQNAHPLLTRETKEVHGGIIHAEKYRKGLCLLTSKEMGMRRLAVTVRACKKVEVELTIDS